MCHTSVIHITGGGHVVASRELFHFVYRNGNWYQDESELIKKDSSIRYVATVLCQGRKRLILIEQLQSRLTRDRQWLDTDSYPRVWFDERLTGDGTCRFRIRQRTQKTPDSTVPQKFSTKIGVKNNRLNFMTDDENVVNKTHGGRFDYFASFSTSEFSRGEHELSIYVRASISIQRKSLLNAWNAFFGATLQPLLLNKIEKVNRLASATTKAEEKRPISNVASPKHEKQDPIIAEVFSERRENSDDFVDTPSTEDLTEHLVSLPKSRVVGQYLRDSAIEISNWLLKKITDKRVTYVSMALILVSFFLLSLFMRDSSLRMASALGVLPRRADIASQYVFFILALISPALAWALEKQLLKIVVVSRHEQGIRLSSRSYYQQTRTLKRLIEGIVFSFITYLCISIVAWSNVSESTHLWLWSDRQTLGLVITMLVGVLSALLSNSLRDLSTQNTLTVVNTRRNIEEIRYLLNEIHELADRFWSEYDAHYKNIGKIFLFRANQFAKYSHPDQTPPINRVLRKIDLAIQEVLGSSSVSVNTSEAKSIIDLLETSSVFQNYEWTEGGVLHRHQQSTIVPWVEHFQVSDVLTRAVTHNFTPGDFLLQATELLEEFEADSDSERSDKSMKSFEEVLNTITKRFLANNDGRFCVAEISDKQKQILRSLRLIKAVIADVPLLPVNGEEHSVKQVWGYYPTDERLTIWFMHAMRESSDWLAMESPDQMESLKDAFETWLHDVYQATVDFEKKNQTRVVRLDDLVQKLEKILSTEGLASGLVLDDIHLLRILLSVGSDAQIKDGHENVSRNDRDATLAKVITYASTYYSVLVWGRGSDRALLPSFPSPFAAVHGVETRSRHATIRLENLGHALLTHLTTTDGDNEISIDMQRRIVFEISNRQGPLLNWLRASRAYRRREKFLFRSITDDVFGIEDGLIVQVPETRDLMMRQLFYDEFVAKEQTPDDFNLFNEVNQNGEIVRITGPRSLKSARKSSYTETTAIMEVDSE